MIHVILGLIVVMFGCWAISHNWWAFVDFFKVLFPFLLVCLGITMILAGVRGKPKVKKEGKDE